jgi:bifunctional enzyme CysN/CysC
VVLVSFISPYRAERDTVRSLLGEHEFVEVFVDTPLEECARRDPKGLYKKAFAGELINFTGVDAPYEAPEKPDLHIRTMGRTPQEIVDKLMDEIARRELAGAFQDGGGI